jgi:pimeloyl-ACP methyl ester carboxylesterase
MESQQSSVDAVQKLDGFATRLETPCGSGSMVWRKWGEGPPLVLLHGGHGAWTHWIRNIPYYAASYTVWAPDLPGHGESATPERTDSGDTIAEVIATGLRMLLADEAPLDVVGFSLGAVLATYLAAVAPELVRRLILVDPGGLGTPLGDVRMASFRGLTEPAEITAAHRQNLLTVMIRHPETIDALALHVQATNVALCRINPRPIVMPDLLLKALVRTETPVDAIWGELDNPHPDPEHQRAALARYRPHLRFRVVEDAGHWNMYERPEGFHRALDDLLALGPGNHAG